MAAAITAKMRPAFLSQILALLNGGVNRSNAMSQTIKINNQGKPVARVPVSWMTASGWNVFVRIIKREAATFWLPDAGLGGKVDEIHKVSHRNSYGQSKTSVTYESGTHR